jgi:hypothetical protein
MKKINLNGSEYFVSIAKKDIGHSYETYRIRFLKLNFGLWKYIKKYCFMYQYSIGTKNFNKDMDKVIGVGIEKFKLHLKEIKYLNDSSELIFIDEQWKEAIYKELYPRVIQELRDKDLLKGDYYLNE